MKQPPATEPYAITDAGRRPRPYAVPDEPAATGHYDIAKRRHRSAADGVHLPP
ncbi:hypothetical protein [Streptomyces sp. NPDC018833]|uniref:hypothetical protein n=1 Tax=Streptomyces sp. NPDC018833 TaxID=3365053 RepID=UPI0037AC2DC8